MKRKCAVFTTVKNESVFLPIWLRHYQQYFENQDIYVLDHHSTDESTAYLSVNVKTVANEYVNDHEWLVKIAQDFQRELLKKYQCVIFAESDEILYSVEKPLNQIIDEFIESDDLYVTFSGYSVIQDIQNEPGLQSGDLIFEKRRYWYKDAAEDKTLMSKIPLDWNWGFHSLKGRNNNYHSDCYIAHLHRFDFQTMVQRHQERTSFKQKQDGGGTHWKSNQNDIFEVFQKISSQPLLIPEHHQLALKHLEY